MPSLKKVFFLTSLFLLTTITNAFASDYSNILNEKTYTWEITLSSLFVLSILGYITAFIFNKKIDKSVTRDKKEFYYVSRKRMLYVSSILLVISIILTIVWIMTIGKTSVESIEVLNKNVKIEVETFKEEGRNHIEADVMPEYKNDPPTSGDHFISVTRYGFYKKEVDKRILLHNMEHGDVVIYYNPKLNDKTIDELKYFSRFTKLKGVFGSGVVVVPNDSMKIDIIATSWNKKMELEKYNNHKIGQFIYNHIQNGPENVPMMR